MGIRTDLSSIVVGSIICTDEIKWYEYIVWILFSISGGWLATIFMGPHHYDDVIMGTMASQITSLTNVYSIVYSGTDQIKHQSSASLAFVRRIHRGPVNSPHKGPVTRKMFPFDDVIMLYCYLQRFRLASSSNCSEEVYGTDLSLVHIMAWHQTDAIVYWCIYALLGRSELTLCCSSIHQHQVQWNLSITTT